MQKVHAIFLGIYLFFVATSLQFVRAEDQDNEKFEKFYAKFHELVEKINPHVTMQALIMQENRKFARMLFDELQGNGKESLKKDDTDKESHKYEPKKPVPLSEQEKKIPVRERIAQKYIGEIPSQVNDIIGYFNNFEYFKTKKKTGIFNRILLHGEPGTGKTYLFSVLAQELQIESLIFNASDFQDKYIGESSRRIRKVFDVARSSTNPLLIFIDEIDAIATKRKDTTHAEHRATLITLLTELQDLQPNKNVVVFFATNDLEALDRAIKDRFAGVITEIKELDVKNRLQLFKKFFADQGEIIDDRYSQRLAEITDCKQTDKSKCFSNRDMQQIVNRFLNKVFIDEQENNRNNKKLCTYLRQIIDETGKPASFNYISTFCDGI